MTHNWPHDYTDLNAKLHEFERRKAVPDWAVDVIAAVAIAASVVGWLL